MPTPSAEQITRGLRGFDRLYGLELLDVQRHRGARAGAVRDELKQPAGLVHGGVYASIAESIASLATGSRWRRRARWRSGSSNSTSFLRPITEGTVHALATRLHRGRTTWVWDVRSATTPSAPAR